MERKRKAFTLIELLVVISIIALLLAIMMPALGMVKEKAKTVVCRSYNRQWGTIFHLYTNDYEGKFPVMGWALGGGTSGAGEGTWIIPMEPYYGGASTKDEQISVCPSTKKGVITENATDPHTWIWEQEINDKWYRNSYAINNWIYSTVNPSPNAWQRRGSKYASTIPMFLEGFRWGGGFSDRTDVVPPNRDAITNASYPAGRYLVDRHDLAINVTFMDGHVEKVGFKGLWDLKWHKSYETRGEYPDWPEWMRDAKGER